MTPTFDLDVALRAMDPVAGEDLYLRNGDLERILASDPCAADGHSHPASTRRTGRRLLVAGVAAAAVAGMAMVTWPGGGDEAYAGWTARPVGVPAVDLGALGAQCRELLTGPGGGEASPVTAGVPIQEVRAVLAERRGHFTLTVVEGGGNLGHCWTEDDGGSAAGLSRAIDPEEAPGPGELSFLDFGGGSKGGPDPDKVAINDALIILGGKVGPDVTAVTLHPQGQIPVQATVENGYWTALWPYELISTKMPTPLGVTAELALADTTTSIEDLTTVINFENNGWWPQP